MKRPSAGYTIVEVMIFLAVTGALFFIAISAFKGQNQKTQFTQGVRDLESKMQDVVNDINNGNFSSTSLLCNANYVTGPTIDSSGGSQGANDQCLFVGKVIGIRDDGLQIDTLAGNRKQSANGAEVTDIAQSLPVKVSQLEEQYEMPNSIVITKVIDTNNPGNSLSGFAITSSFGQAGNGGDLASDTLSSSLIPIQGSINSTPSIANLTPNNRGVIICLRSDYDSTQWGLVFIGSAGKLTTSSALTRNPPVECTT